MPTTIDCPGCDAFGYRETFFGDTSERRPCDRCEGIGTVESDEDDFPVDPALDAKCVDDRRAAIACMEADDRVARLTKVLRWVA